MPLSAGDRLGPYEILAPLGVGGMGEVYRARDSRLNRNVAIKVSAAQYSERFEREAKAIAALNHPNICQIYDVGPDYLVMELIEGESLGDYLKKPLSKERALEIAGQLLEALRAAHSAGIVHRDLKPANIMVRSDGCVKVLDFGLAKRMPVSGVFQTEETVTDLSVPGQILGTVAYMSPEQILGQEIDQRSDLFVLGIILYKMLTGQHPWPRKSHADTLHAILHDGLPPMQAALPGFVIKLLRKNREERYSSAQEVLEDLASPAPSQAPPHSLAVLPLAISSTNPDAEYLADGVTESVINSLARISGLRVMSRSSVFRHRADDTDPLIIGEHLNVQTILTGRLLQSGDQFVIAVELVDVASGIQLWGQRYRRTWADVFEVQDEIATKITHNLRLRLSSEELDRLTKRYTEDPEAYQSYLRGRYFWNHRSFASMRKGVEFFQQAIDRDPAYARAYAGLGDCYSMLGIYMALPPGQAFPKAQAAARRALEIDPEMAEAHACLGFSHMYFDWDLAAAGREFQQAVDLHPGNPSAHQWQGMCLGMLGRTEEAMAAMTRAQRLDPFSASINTTCALPFYWAHRYAEALDRLLEAVDLHPGYWVPHYYIGLIHALQGEMSQALAAFEKAEAIGDSPHRLAGIGYCLGRMGRGEEAEAVLTRVQEFARASYVSPWVQAAIELGLGDNHAAIDSLERAFNDRSWLMVFLPVDPLFDSLRSDPRFDQLRRRVQAGK